MCKNETHSESKHPVRANKIDLIKFEEKVKDLITDITEFILLTFSQLILFKSKTNKYLILRDLMLMHSKTSTLIVM